MLNNLSQYQKSDTSKFTIYICGSTVWDFLDEDQFRKFMQPGLAWKFGTFFPLVSKSMKFATRTYLWGEVN